MGVLACENIDTTLHENGVDVWVTVLEYGAGNMHSFLLTCNGFEDHVITNNVNEARTGDAGRGGICFSHDGTKIAACFPSGWPNSDRQVAVSDFNKETGKLENTEYIGPTSVVLGPYDAIWSKDNSQIIVSKGTGGGAHAVNVASPNTVTEVGGDRIKGVSHSVQIGHDGNYYFNGADGFWRWSGSGDAQKVNNWTGWGLPTIYIPPAEEPDVCKKVIHFVIHLPQKILTPLGCVLEKMLKTC